MNSISVKLFLALFGLTTVILFATIGLARWSFNYGFYDYLDSLEKDQLQRFATQLVGHYENNGERWTADTAVYFDEILAADLHSPDSAPTLATNNQILRAALNQSLEDELKKLPNLNPQEIEELVNSMPAFGMGPPRFGVPGPPMGPMGTVDIWKPNTPLLGMSGSLSDDNISQKRPALPEQMVLKNPAVLLDASGARIAGASLPANQDAFMSQAIVVDGVIVGELRAPLSREFQTPLESAFSAQHKLASVSIIALSLLLAAIASWALSRMMLAPIVKLKDGIAELANGDYKNQLVVDRKDELGMLMRDVNKLGSNLLKNRASRRGWLADISHELRTPVTVLSGEIEALRDGVRDLTIDSVESLDHEVNRLKLLIDDLYQLSLSDIGGLRYVFKRLNLSELLSTITAQHRPQVVAAGLTLASNLSKEFWVQADKARLEQLFTNLINNSIAYTDAPGQIEISMQVVGNDIFVSVQDSAPSVAEESLPMIFAPLFREEKSRSRREGGAGLGLTICRNIVVAHGATIEAGISALGGVKIEMKFSAA